MKAQSKVPYAADLRVYMRLMAKFGVTRLKIGNIEIETRVPVSDLSALPLAEVSPPSGQSAREYTEEELMFLQTEGVKS